jgi:hypothetical protein
VCVRLSWRIARSMSVLMVIIVRMRVGVLYWQMFVFMGVVFG